MIAVGYIKNKILLLTKCCKGVIVISNLQLQGVVQVSTGSLKMEKLSVVGHHVKSSNLKLNAEDNLALAA